MKRFNIILALFCIVALSSCDEFLDKQPTNAGDSASAIQTVFDAEVMINGINDKMLSSSYLGRNMIMYGDCKGGDLTILTAGRGLDYMYSFNHTFNSYSMSGFWTTGYNIILQLNNLITNIDRLEEEGTTEDFDDVKGQALTLRGMLYFDLVRLYGEPYNENSSALGVPNITTVLDATAEEPRATVAQNYETILNDLKAAESIIGKSKNDGFVNYWANKALQARVYMSMDDFSNALAAAEDVINNGPYSLYSNSEWVASWASKEGKESIFQLYMLATEGNLGSGSIGAYYARRNHYGSSGGCFIASEYFMELLGEDPDDVRWGIMTYDEDDKTRMSCNYKYLGTTDAKGDGDSDAASVNIKVIRLSEVYLIAAEAALRKASPDKELACEYLNAIRKRSPNLDPATEETITHDMILNEKAKELHGEGQRYWDLIRCNKTIEFNDDLYGIPVHRRGKTIDRTSYLTILPIPESEMIINSNMEQNPQY